MIFDDLIVDQPCWVKPEHIDAARSRLLSATVFSIEEGSREFIGMTEATRGKFPAGISGEIESLKKVGAISIPDEFKPDEEDATAKSPWDDEPLEPLPSPLPYEELAICFEDAVVYVQGGCDWDNGWPAVIGVTMFHALPRDAPEAPPPSGGFHITRVKGKARTWWPKHQITTHILYSDKGEPRGWVPEEQLQGEFELDNLTPHPDSMSMIGKSHLILWRFLAFLSCTNVRARDIAPAKVAQQMRRLKGRPPLVTHKVLELQPRTSAGGGESKGLWTNRVHLCRGHFATYTKEAPLFGKYVGRFWIPPHARGDRSRGVITKEYALGDELMGAGKPKA
jgi:hypothetical protein